MRRIYINILLILFILLATNTLSAQNCPRAIKDCRGLCGWYVDLDRDGFCDLTLWSNGMISKKQRCADSIAAVKAAEKEKRRQDSLANLQQSNNDVQEVKNTSIEKANPNNTPQQTIIPTPVTPVQNTEIPTNPSLTAAPAVPQSSPSKSSYDLILICSASLLLYLLTFYLSRRNLIKKTTHRKIWNGLLLITFLATGLIGLFLVIQLNYSIKLDWFSSLLYYHVEFGIGMAAISIFHILWHLRYWIHIFDKAGKK